VGPLGHRCRGPRLQKARAKALGLCSADAGGVLCQKYRLEPNMPGLNGNKADREGALAPIPLGDSAESSGGRYSYPPVLPGHSVKGAHELPRVPQGHLQGALFSPKARPSAACTYMAADFSPTYNSAKWTDHSQNSFSVMVQVQLLLLPSLPSLPPFPPSLLLYLSVVD
jgi:hypothetical protein